MKQQSLKAQLPMIAFGFFIMTIVMGATFKPTESTRYVILIPTSLMTITIILDIVLNKRFRK